MGKYYLQNAKQHHDSYVVNFWRENKNIVKDKYSLLFRTHPQSLLVLWPCYVIYLCEMGYFLRRNVNVTGLLHNRIMTPNKQEYLSLTGVRSSVRGSLASQLVLFF